MSRELIAVPNVSEGKDAEILEAIGAAFTADESTRILDLHSDPDHGRSVFTLAGRPGSLGMALARGARAAADLIDLSAHSGAHPHVGALDVAPVVFLDDRQRPAALVEALVAAAELADAGLSCFLYGLLAEGRTRAELRRGGVDELARRVAAGELAPDFGSVGADGEARIDPRTGAVLVAARPPLIAFNLELAPPATLADAKAVAARLREGGPDGLRGLRAIGLTLPARDGVAQVSMNVEDHLTLPLAAVVEAVAGHAPVAAAEIVGLPPAAALLGYPEHLPTRGRRTLEQALQ